LKKGGGGADISALVLGGKLSWERTETRYARKGDKANLEGKEE